MTKNDFIAKLSIEMGISTKEAGAFISAFENTMINEVFKKNEKVAFTFGTFKGVDKHTNARIGRNPKDGSEIRIPARDFKHLPKFTPSKSMKVEE